MMTFRATYLSPRPGTADVPSTYHVGIVCETWEAAIGEAASRAGTVGQLYQLRRVDIMRDDEHAPGA